MDNRKGLNRAKNIKIADVGNKLAATNVEDAIAELAGDGNLQLPGTLDVAGVSKFDGEVYRNGSYQNKNIISSGARSAFGWYRIAEFDSAGDTQARGGFGYSAIIHLSRIYNESWTILLNYVYDKATFKLLGYSVNQQLFTEIRLTTPNNGSFKTYIDVYYSSSIANVLFANVTELPTERSGALYIKPVNFTLVSTLVGTVRGHLTLIEDWWKTPQLLNGWINYPGYSNVGFYKDTSGIVRLRGLVQAGAMGSSIFILPVGYRIGGRGIFTVISNSAIGRVDVLPDGSVLPVQGSNGWVTLEGITFRAEQ